VKSSTEGDGLGSDGGGMDSALTFELVRGGMLRMPKWTIWIQKYVMVTWKDLSFVRGLTVMYCSSPLKTKSLPGLGAQIYLFFSQKTKWSIRYLLSDRIS